MKKIKKISAIIGVILILSTLFAVPCFAVGFDSSIDFGLEVNGCSHYYSVYEIEYSEDEDGNLICNFLETEPRAIMHVLLLSFDNSDEMYYPIFTNEFYEKYVDFSKSPKEIYLDLKSKYFAFVYMHELIDSNTNSYSEFVKSDSFHYDLFEFTIDETEFVKAYNEQFGWAKEYSDEQVTSAVENANTISNETISTLEAEKQELQTEIDGLNEQVSNLGAEKTALQTQVNGLDKQVDSLSNNNAILNAEVRSLENQMQLKINKAYAEGLTDSEGGLTTSGVISMLIAVVTVGEAVALAFVVVSKIKKKRKRK